MKILLVHNRYREAGGEDMVFVQEAGLLRRRGHDVVEYVEDNSRIDEIGRAAAAVRAVRSPGTRARLLALIQRERPVIAHFHNIFPLISPSAYTACSEAGVPVVQTLHNYRLLCAAALFFRSGRPCEDCMGRRVLWPGVLHGCYRQSRLETAGVTLMIQAHRAAGIWRSRVDLFIALSQFARKKFIEGGLPAKKILVKPNFVHPDPGPRRMEEDFALFVGRLSKEKGIGVLLDAWRRVPEIPLVICGDGPMRELVNRFARSLPRGKIRFVQSLSRPHVFDAMRRARFLVFPSICYESFPMVVAEALACGLPVLASGIGAAAEIVEDGKTGVHFAPGDPDALASAAGRLWSSPSEARESGARARAEFLARYTAERAHASLMEIYSRARKESGQG